MRSVCYIPRLDEDCYHPLHPNEGYNHPPVPTVELIYDGGSAFFCHPRRRPLLIIINRVGVISFTRDDSPG